MTICTTLLGRARWLVLALFTLGGCNVDSRLTADTDAPGTSSGVDPAGAVVRVLDATSNTEWVYFDLASNSVVYPSDPYNSSQWDIAFRRFIIKVNGGVSGTGNVAVATLEDTDFATVAAQPSATVQAAAIDTAALSYYTDRALMDLSDAELISLDAGRFFPVCADGFDCINENAGSVDRAYLNPQSRAYVFMTRGSGQNRSNTGNSDILGWYDYFPDEGHILRPAGDTWIVRTVEGLMLKLDLLGYYGLNVDRESGTMAFRFQSLTPGFDVPEAGDGQLQVSVAADVTQGTTPFTVNFSAESSGGTATQWDWDFGDGGTGSGGQIAHVYQSAGIFTARVTVTDDRGAQASGARVISVQAAGNSAPDANAGPDQIFLLLDGVNQVQVSLDGSASSDSDGQIVSYVWSGTPDPDDQARPQVILGVGSHVFTLTVTDDQGNSASDQVNITVNAADNQAPQAVASVSAGSGAVPFAVQFTGSNSSDADGSLVAWHWDFGDGASADEADPAHNYTTPGTYTATLTVTDDQGAAAIATVEVQANVVVPASADTYVYEFLGNQSPSAATLVWNHEANHGARALMDFDDLDAWLATLPSGSFTATLNLYHECQISGFVGACPGDADVDSPGGVATVTTDIKVQAGAWPENDAAVVWSTVQEGTKYADFSVASATAGWIQVDITALVAAWSVAGTTGDGIVLTQEAYPVVRADSGAIAVLRWLSKEHATTSQHPYIEIAVGAP